MSSVSETAAQPLPVIQVDHDQVHKHLDALVRDSVYAPDAVDARLAGMATTTRQAVGGV